jgi:hypothetical protein
MREGMQDNSEEENKELRKPNSAMTTEAICTVVKGYIWKENYLTESKFQTNSEKELLLAMPNPGPA